MAAVTFDRKTVLAIDFINNNSNIWDYSKVVSNYKYASGDSDGFYVFDITAPLSPLQVTQLNLLNDPVGAVRLRAPLISGTHTGANNSAVLIDGSKSFATDELVNYIVTNESKVNERMAVTSNTATTVTGNRIGGGTPDWDTGDSYTMTRDISVGVTDIVVDEVNSIAYICARTISFQFPEPGFIAAYDISSPEAPQWINTFQGPDIAPITVPPFEVANPIESGTDDASTSATFLTDTTQSWSNDEFVGKVLRNTAGGKNWDVYISSNTATTITGNRIDGGVVDWDSGDTYEISSRFPQNWWPQGMVLDPLDPSRLHVACQAGGFYELDVSDPANIAVADSYTQSDLQVDYPNWANDGLYWETSRIAWNNGHVFLANHGNGVQCLDVSGVSVANVQQYPAPIVNNFGTPTTLRTRNVLISGNWLFECNNDADIQSPERGYIARNIRNPGGAEPLTFYHTPIGIADNDDPWIGAGDEPILGLSKYGNYLFYANGQRGTAVFDATDPTNAVYLGLQGTNLPADTNLYFTDVFDYNGEVVAYYSDGKEPLAEQKHNLFVDKVTGGDMATIDYVGLNPSESGPLGTTFVITTSFSGSPGNSADRVYGPTLGTETITGGGIQCDSSGPLRTVDMALYIATSPTDPTPTTKITDTDMAVTVTNTGGTQPNTGTITAGPYTPPPGIYLTLGFTSSGTTNVDRQAGALTYSRDNTGGGVLPATWSDDANPVADALAWFEVSIPDGSTPPPVYDGSYTNQQFGFGDSGSLDLSGAWTGADSYEFIGLPPWMTQVGTTAVLNYVDASWGTEGNEAKNAIGDGVWDIQVAGVNAGGKTATSFWLRVGP